MSMNGNRKVTDRRAAAGLTVFRYRSKSCSQMLTSSTTNNLSNASSFSNDTNSSSSSSGMTKASIQNNIGAILLQKHSVQEAAERFHAAILTAMDNHDHDTRNHNHVPREHQHPHQNEEESWFRLRNHQQAEEEEMDETMKQFPLPQRPACKLVQVDSSGLDWFYNKLKREQQHGGGGGTGADSSTQQTNHIAGQNNNSNKAPIAHDASNRTNTFNHGSVTYPRNNEASTTNTTSTAGGFQSGNDYLQYKANALDTLERRIPLGLEFITQPIHIPSSTATNTRNTISPPPPPPLYKRNYNFKEQEGDSEEEEEDGVEENPYLDRNAICAAFLNLARIRLEYDYTGSVKYERTNHNTQQQHPTTQKGLERNSMKDILKLCLASIDPPISLPRQQPSSSSSSSTIANSNTPTQSSKQSTLLSSSSSSADNHTAPVRPVRFRGKMNRSQSVHISSSPSSSHATNDIFSKTNHKSQKQPRDLLSLHHNTQHQRQQHHKPKRKKKKQQKLLPSLEIIARNNIGVLKFAQNRMNEAKHEFELAYNILSKVQSSSSSSFSTSITSNKSKPPPTRPHLKRCSSIDECTTQEHSESDSNGVDDENDEEPPELVPVLPYDYLYITTLINLSRTCIQIKDLQRAQELLDCIDSLPSSLTMMLPLVSSSSPSPSPDQSISSSLFSPPSPGRLMRSSTSSPWKKRSSITNNVTNTSTTTNSYSHYHHHILNQRYKYLHSTLSKNYHHGLLNQQQEHFQLALEHYNAMIYACREDHHLGGTTNSWRNGTARRNSLCGNNHHNNNDHNYHHQRNNRHHNSLYVSILLEKKGNVLFDMGKLGQAMLSYLACLKVYEFEERELNQLTPSHMRMTNVTSGNTNNSNHRNHHQHYYAIEKSRILYAIGRTHHDRVEYPDALTVYQKALTYLPTSSSSAIEILTNVGRLHRNMGNLELALETNLQIVNLATAIIVGKHIAGRSSTDEVSSSNDSHDDIALQHAFVRNRLVALGNLYVESGRLNDAMDVFARVERFRTRANLDQVRNSYYTEEEEEDVDTNALAVKAAKRLGKTSSRKMKPHAAAA